MIRLAVARDKSLPAVPEVKRTMVGLRLDLARSGNGMIAWAVANAVLCFGHHGGAFVVVDVGLSVLAAGRGVIVLFKAKQAHRYDDSDADIARLTAVTVDLLERMVTAEAHECERSSGTIGPERLAVVVADNAAVNSRVSVAVATGEENRRLLHEVRADVATLSTSTDSRLGVVERNSRLIAGAGSVLSQLKDPLISGAGIVMMQLQAPEWIDRDIEAPV